MAGVVGLSGEHVITGEVSPASTLKHAVRGRGQGQGQEQGPEQEQAQGLVAAAGGEYLAPSGGRFSCVVSTLRCTLERDLRKVVSCLSIVNLYPVYLSTSSWEAKTKVAQLFPLVIRPFRARTTFLTGTPNL